MHSEEITSEPNAESAAAGGTPAFESVLRGHGLAPLRREVVKTLQVNVGKLCNQACHHCHVDAGPKRTERMSRPVAERVMALLAASPSTETVDITGGAPELNLNFPYLVERARQLGRCVIDRCNLTVLLEPGMEWVPEFLRAHEVDVIASLPCYTAENVEQQRGRGVFDQSIAALRRLNRLGYGQPGSHLRLDLVYNPLGAALAPPQERLEADYRRVLRGSFGIEFHHLLTITNMPIKRFSDQLARWGQEETYMALLEDAFNPAAVPGLMCRSLVSVGWDGSLYDCDFNQMLELPLAGRGRPTVFDLESLDELDGAAIATARHCLGCTAGAGSSCGGTTVRAAVVNDRSPDRPNGA
jgi:radical SAM/Cys-rich protein